MEQIAQPPSVQIHSIESDPAGFRGKLRRIPTMGYIVSMSLGLAAALPWLYEFSYSRGYDFFLWVYNAWHLRNSIYMGHWPNWSIYGACGQPFFKIAGITDGIVLAGAMEIWGMFRGVKAFVLLQYIMAATGMNRLSHSLLKCRISAFVATAAYVLSWFVTFTLYFQAYLSNAFVYAAMPWFALFMRKAISTRNLLLLWASATILSFAILANPQVAIKMLVIGGILTFPLLQRHVWRTWLAVWLCVIIVSIAFSLFDIASALRLRDEVLTINARKNSPVSPFTLVAIPSFGLSLIVEALLGQRWPQIPLWELLYSEYPGLVTSVLAIAALIYIRENLVKWLWFWVIVSYVFFFVAMPELPASPWLGTSHNLLIIPVFLLALLSGYGARALRGVLRSRWGVKRSRRGLYVGMSLLFVECYGLLLGLKIWGASGGDPLDLPEIRVWDKIADTEVQIDREERFFTFNPDWTIGLFPVLTRLPVANVIELRQRSPDYQAYIDLVMQCGKSSSCRADPSVLLAPLNVAWIDVPFKYFAYVGPNSAMAEYGRYTEGLVRFDGDRYLQRLADRPLVSADFSPQATSIDWSPLQRGKPIERKGLAQVVYENSYHLSAFVAPRTVAIVGKWEDRSEVFARIVNLPNYDPAQVLFLLVDSLEVLDPRHRLLLDGYIDAEMKAQDWSSKLRSWYDSPQVVPYAIESWQREDMKDLHIRLDQPVKRDGFLFVSQQYFRDWGGWDASGERLSLYKATAGLTAVFLKAGTRDISLRYQLPAEERWSRYFSLLSFVLVAAISGGVEIRKGGVNHSRKGKMRRYNVYECR